MLMCSSLLRLIGRGHVDAFSMIKHHGGLEFGVGTCVLGTLSEVVDFACGLKLVHLGAVVAGFGGVDR